MSEGTAREIAKTHVLVERSLIDRLAFDLDKGNTRSAFGHARYLVDRARSKTAPAAEPATLTGDERSEKFVVLEKATLLRWRDIADATATTLPAEIDRELWIAEPREDVAPAADAATGEPS